MENKDGEELTRIPVTVQTREDLSEIGNKGQTYNDIIQEMIQE